MAQDAPTIDAGNIEYLCFEGGGGKGLMYAGSLLALQHAFEANGKSTHDKSGAFKWPVKGVSGASAGAIISYFVTIGYSPRDLACFFIRDGAFSALFSEKIRHDYYRAIARENSDDKASSVVPGWYGQDNPLWSGSFSGWNRNRGKRNKDIFGNDRSKPLPDLTKTFDKGGLAEEESLQLKQINNVLRKYGWRSGKDNTTTNHAGSGLPNDKAKSSQNPFAELKDPKLRDLMYAVYLYVGYMNKTVFGLDTNPLNPKNNILPIDWINGKNLIKPFGTFGEFLKGFEPILDWYKDVLIDTIIQFLLEHVNIKAPDFEKFVDLFNENATNKLHTILPLATIGGSSWLQRYTAVLVAPLGLVGIIILKLATLKTKEGSQDDLAKTIGSFSRDLDKGHIVSRNEGFYLFELIVQIWWNNLVNEESLRSLLKPVLTLTSSVGLAKTIAELTTGDDKRKEAAKKSLSGIVTSFLKATLFSPVSKDMFHSLVNEGGLLQGDKMREILVAGTINKCRIEQLTSGGEIKLKRRLETLSDTLDRISYGAYDLATLMVSIDMSGPSTTHTLVHRDPIANNPQKRPVLGKTKDVIGTSDDKAVDSKLINLIDEIDQLMQFILSETSENIEWPKTEDLNLTKFRDQLKTKVRLMESSTLYPEQDFKGTDLETQLDIIRNKLSFEKLYEFTEIDLVITGSNITKSRPVYFRKSLTPDFPVIEAIAMSGSYPGLFRPAAVSYTPSEEHYKNISGLSYDFYAQYYQGYFLDGGIFNNLPILAFNYQEQNSTEGVVPPTPMEMVTKPFNEKVLAFNLTSGKDNDRVFKPKFKAGSSDRNLQAVVGGLLNALDAGSEWLRYGNNQCVEENIVPVLVGNQGLFDMKPNLYAIFDMDAINYAVCSNILTGQIPKRDFSDTQIEKLYKDPFGDSLYHVGNKKTKEGRQARNRLKKMLKIRKRIAKKYL